MHYMELKLNEKNFIISHIDDTLFKTMPEINQVLLQFIDVMDLVDLLLYFSPSVSSMTHVISGVKIGEGKPNVYKSIYQVQHRNQPPVILYSTPRSRV